jgi:hypothetical protein
MTKREHRNITFLISEIQGQEDQSISQKQPMQDERYVESVKL